MSKKSFDDQLSEIEEKMKKFQEKMRAMEEKKNKIIHQKTEEEKRLREERNQEIVDKILSLTGDRIEYKPEHEKYIADYLHAVFAFLEKGIEDGNLRLPSLPDSFDPDGFEMDEMGSTTIHLEQDLLDE